MAYATSMAPPRNHADSPSKVMFCAVKPSAKWCHVESLDAPRPWSECWADERTEGVALAAATSVHSRGENDLSATMDPMENDVGLDLRSASHEVDLVRLDDVEDRSAAESDVAEVTEHGDPDHSLKSPTTKALARRRGTADAHGDLTSSDAREAEKKEDHVRHAGSSWSGRSFSSRMPSIHFRETFQSSVISWSSKIIDVDTFASARRA